MFREIIQNSPQGVLVTDETGQIVFCNKSSTSFFSSPCKCQIGVSITDIFPGLTVVNGNIKFIERFERADNIVEVLNHEGSVRYFEAYFSHTSNEDFSDLNVVTLSEVTSRIHALQATQDQEARWNFALQGSRIGVFESNLPEGTGFASETWYELLGLSKIKLRDSDAEWHARVHPDDLDLVKSIDARCIEGLSERAEAKFRMQIQDGTWHWMKSILTVVERDNNGKAVRLLGTMTDITEEKMLDELKDSFVSTVSHELRTPLASIYGALVLLTEFFGQNTPTKIKKLLDIAHRNASRLLHVVDDLLDFQKLSTGHFSVQMKPLNIGTLVRQVTIDNEFFAHKFGVSYALDVPEQELNVSADPFRLKQVITNLLSNAAKFSFQGGVVTVRVACERETCIIYVSDNGRGVSSEFSNRIFTPFSQQAEHLTRNREGSGLGLSISKNLIEKMSGEIGYESEPNVQTVFWIRLPLLWSNGPISQDE